MKKIRILNYIIIIINLMLYFLSIFNSNLSISYITALMFFILLFLITFICGIIINEEKVYKNNLNVYLFLYFILLFSLTMLIGRESFTLLNKEFFKSYVNYINFVPFRTITSYMSKKVSISVIYNILGNFVALMPLSLLLMLKSKRNKKISFQFLKISFIVFIIEFLQFVFACGRLDIDDYILNVSGALFFCFVILKMNLFPKISKVFLTDLSINKHLKNLALIIIILIIIMFDLLIASELYDTKKYVLNKSKEIFLKPLDNSHSISV
jgi:glycopeptide antibiotics resistance protein